MQCRDYVELFLREVLIVEFGEISINYQSFCNDFLLIVLEFLRLICIEFQNVFRMFKLILIKYQLRLFDFEVDE